MTLSQRAVEAAAEEFENLDYRDIDSMPSKEIATRMLTAALAVDGLCLVPRVPTEAMLRAAQATNNNFTPDKWIAMIAAASTGDSPPAGTEG